MVGSAGGTVGSKDGSRNRYTDGCVNGWRDAWLVG